MTTARFVRGAAAECDGCPHRHSYPKYWCGLAKDDYCDSEERCRVEDKAEEAGEENDE